MVSSQKLRDRSQHIHYEIAQLRWIVEYLIQGKYDDDTVVQNALIESAGVHVRSLLKFFYDTKDQRDIKAKDFFDDRRYWESVRPKKTEFLKKVEDRANTEIAHLSRQREKEPGRGEWSFVEIYDALLPLVGAFQDKVPEGRLHDAWSVKFEAIQPESTNYEPNTLPMSPSTTFGFGDPTTATEPPPSIANLKTVRRPTTVDDRSTAPKGDASRGATTQE